MKAITKKQKMIYDFICNYIDQNERPPTIIEIRTQFNYASNQAVIDHLAALEKKGYIRRQGKSRGTIPLKRKDKFPILGNISAGTPIFADEQIEGSLRLDEYFDANNSYVLKVHGDSMIGVGIFDGDYVIVKHQQQVKNGEIGVALLGEDATVKRIFYKEDRIILQPENNNYEPIIINEDIDINFCICGKVIGLVRNNISNMRYEFS